MPLGAQRPRIFHVPEYLSSAGDEAIELAATAGLHLDDWQQFVLRHALGERADGKWSAATVGLVVGRQNGKDAIAEARELAGLFLLGEELIIHTAHLQRTASEHFRRLLKLIRSTPELESLMLRATMGKGDQSIELKSGQRILFTTRTGGGGRGLTADLRFYNEAMHLSEAERSALTPTAAALSIHGNTQNWYMGSAVDQQNPTHDGMPFAQVRESGIAGAERVAWFEFSAPGDDPDAVRPEIAADPHMWALANPGLGIRISHEYVEHERTVEMGARGFAVERLSIGDWPALSDEAERVISKEAWRTCECTDPSKQIVGAKSFAIDVSPDRSWGTISVAGRRDDRLAHVAVAEHERSTDWIIHKLPPAENESEERWGGAAVELHQAHPGSRFVIDTRGPAANLIPALKAAGLEVIEASTKDYADACAVFFDAVVHRRMRYPVPQPELSDAVAAARKAPLGDAWKWSRKHSTSADITPLVSGTLALWAVESMPESAPLSPMVAFR